MNRIRRAIGSTAKILLAVFFLSLPLPAQVSVALDESASYPAARIGLNQGTQDYFESYLLKNLTGINPGFEGHIKDVVQNVAGAGTDRTFAGSSGWDTTPADFYAGGSFFVAYGADRGCEGKIASNTAGDPGKEPAKFTLASPCAHPFSRGDVIFTRKDVFPTPAKDITFESFGWKPQTGGGGAVSIDSKPADQPPGSPGKQCIELSDSGSIAAAGVQTEFDTSQYLNYDFSGRYTQTVKARLVSGSGALTLSGIRLNPGHDGIRWSQSFTPNGQWSTYSARFYGGETTQTAPGPVEIGISFQGNGVLLIDDSSLTSDSDNNPTVFRNRVILDEKLWDPGESRYWAGQNAETLSDWITPQFGRQGTVNGGNAGVYDQIAQIQYGLHDWLVKEAYEGVPQVWIELPITWRYDTDALNIVDYLAGGADTAYGAKRIALGQTAPWTSVFHRIVLEYGNEVWNGAANGECIIPYSIGPRAYWPYVPMAVRFCASMKASPRWNGAVMKCAAGLQSGNSFWAGQLKDQDPTHAVDVQANNEYGQLDVTNTIGQNQWISAWTEAWAAAYDKTNGFNQTFNASGIQTGVYEYNNSTESPSTLSPADAIGYPDGEGYGLVDILMPLLDQKVFGVVDTDFFTLAQRQRSFSNAAHKDVVLKEWGAVTALGGAKANPRPMFFAASLIDSCIGGGVGYAATAAGGPSYDFTGYNGVGPEKNVPYLSFFAFKQGGSRCIVVVNLDPNHSYTFAFTGDHPPSGNVTARLYYSPNLTDSNETEQTVRLASATSPNPSSFQIQPHAAMTIRYKIGSGITPIVKMR